MTTMTVDPAAVRDSRVHRAYRFLVPDLVPTHRAGALRQGVERGIAVTLAIVALLLVALAFPEFSTDHRWNDAAMVSLPLAALMVVALPLALMRRTGPVRAGLWMPVAFYVGLLVLEPFTIRNPLPEGATPWLLGLSLIAFSCTAVAEANSVRAAAVCGGINIALACVYAGRIPLSHSLVNLVGLGLLATALVVGVRGLRVRADQADIAEHRAQLLFAEHQRQVAMDSQRAHTDALLHDTVLAALMTTARGDAPERAASMAGEALQIVSDAGDDPAHAPESVRFGETVTTARLKLAAFAEFHDIDLEALADVEMPSEIADALLSATLQAITNSVKHAGPSARRSVRATRLRGGGARIVILDDGAGFDLGAVPPERLGVRGSILERVRLVGGSASIESMPGSGTRVTLAWHPVSARAPLGRRPAELILTLVPRRRLYRILGVVITIAAIIATTEALLVTRAYSSVVASVLGLAILPTLLRGAKRGSMTNRAAWGTMGVGILLCCIATIGLDPANFDAVSICRYTCGVLAGSVMAWMAGRRLTPTITVVVLIVQVTLWAGPTGVIRLGLAGEIVIVIAGLLVHRALRVVSTSADEAANHHRDLTVKQAELDAFHLERELRLLDTGRSVAPILGRIIRARGHLDQAARTECRVLEQALRDEIRGRSLLNATVRRVISAQRRRGALVQVLDDGGLESISASARERLLDDVARHLEPLRSSRIVIRTGQPESDTAITVVASTPDETAAALGLDSDDEVDLWLSIPRPEPVAAL